MSGSAPELPPFPLDDATLLAVEHALGGAWEVAEDGTRTLVGADYTLAQLLDFLANAVGEDPNEEVVDTGDPLADESGLPSFMRGLAGASVHIDSRPHYSEHDVIAALIVEVRARRAAETQNSLELDRYPALWCSRCGWHQYKHGGVGIDPVECPECRTHHGSRSSIRAVDCVIVESGSDVR